MTDKTMPNAREMQFQTMRTRPRQVAKQSLTDSSCSPSLGEWPGLRYAQQTGWVHARADWLPS
jgi:hypothetical protein